MSFRDVFQKYIDNPEKYGDILFYDDNVIILKDLFPKSLRHYLVIPRHKQVTHQHPLDAFNQDYDQFTGQELYDQLKTYTEQAKQLIIQDLSGILGDSTDDSLNIRKLNHFIKVGIHSIPSLNNLHIHIITKDFHSPKMKNKKHYNSFNTSFFVDFKNLKPTISQTSFDSQDTDESNDDSIDYKKMETLIKNSPLICPYCGKNFQFKFQNLKKHLQLEFENKFKEFKIDLKKLTPNDG